MREAPSITNHSSSFISDKRSGFLALYAALFVFVITIAATAGLFFFNQSQDQAQAKLIEQIKLKEEDLRPKLLDQIFSFDKKLKNAALVLSSHDFVSNTLAVIEKDTHPRVQFSDYQFDQESGNISMVGRAGDFAVLARQISFFESDPNVNSIEFGGVKTSDAGDFVDFKATVSLRPGFIATTSK